MTKSEITSIYKDLREPHQRSMQTWLVNTAVIASISALAIGAMAWAGSVSRQPVQAVAPQEQRSTEVSAAGQAHPAHLSSPHDLMRALPPQHLPEQRVHEPY